jgi:hypothetical protein
VSRALKSLAIFAAIIVIYTLSRHVIHSTTTTTTTTTTTAPHSTTTTTSTTPPVSDACAGQNFSGLYNTGEGAAGTVYATVTLTNTGTTSCTLDGWPILTLQDKLGAVLTSTLVDVPSASNSFQFLAGSASGLKANDAPTTLTLGKNATATFALAYSDVPVGTAACENAVSVFVQFAKNGTPVSLTPSEPVQPCGNGEIWVSPFY